MELQTANAEELSRVLTNAVLGSKQKWRPNHYNSARLAAEAWCDGNLWGNPIVLSENNVHVYGIYLRNWTKVNVWFLKDVICVVKPPRSY